MSIKNNKNPLTIAVCQMPVMPGSPDRNAAYIIEEITKAADAGVEIIVFPEMCISGYLIGDAFEDDAYVKDVVGYHESIIRATEVGITAVFGSLQIFPGEYGEDGRLKKSNAAFVASNGKLIGTTIKTLQPNYRIFDDDRHFYSARKWAEKSNSKGEQNFDQGLFQIDSTQGEVKMGVILCEDMWYEDYGLNPAKELVDKSAEILINLSASPWTWQKNRKRHAVVHKLLSECSVPLIYVNNVGVQNNGKNLIIFDGSSTIYNAQGDITETLDPFFAGTKIIALGSGTPSSAQKNTEDIVQLYQALRQGVKAFVETIPKERRKIIIGLSGGIDSALAAAFYADIVGAENVYLYNMPSKYNSDETKSIAREIATNLRASYETIPIQEVVDSIANATGISENTLAYENIQARVRMEILAAKAQLYGGVFSCNGNKVEMGFGYGTMYGDNAGFLAAFGDLVKREVYQLAEYVNVHVYKKNVIPESCFVIAPTAELKELQRDPFDYGNLNRRGYHDEMIRAFTEFRRNPEWFLEKYREGLLETELKLDPGTLDRLFVEKKDFVADLEHKWNLFSTAYIKRVQAPPIPIVSKRAFGFDLRETIRSPYLTSRYRELRENLLKTI